MKKVVFFILALALCVGLSGQGKKITELPAVTSVADASLLMVRYGATGNTISQINIGQVFTNRTLLGTIVLPSSTSIGLVSSTEIGYVNGVTSNIQTQLDSKASLTGAVNLQDLVTMKTDSATLIVFGAGAGLIADTALFNNNVLIGAFHNTTTDTLVATKMVSVMYSGAGTETISVQISWDANFLDGTPTDLGGSAFVIAGAEALEGGDGEIDTTFSNTKIPPDAWVWGRLSGASSGNKPSFLSVTLACYRIGNHSH